MKSPLESSTTPPKASLATLPRELQDIIFGHLLISSHCVGYVERYGVEIYDENIEHNMAALGANDRMAQGLCEFFYQNNTFRLDDRQLPKFLGSKTHRSANRGCLDDGKVNSTMPRFEVGNWICRLIIRVQSFEKSKKSLLKKLLGLLECPRLKNVILDVETEDGPPRYLFGQKGDVLRQLKAKLGSGLKVYCDMGWSYGNPGISSEWRQDISGMFQSQNPSG